VRSHPAGEPGTGHTRARDAVGCLFLVVGLLFLSAACLWVMFLIFVHNWGGTVDDAGLAVVPAAIGVGTLLLARIVLKPRNP
jgi:hypothetical protein